MTQKRFLGLMIFAALIGIVLLCSNPTAAAPLEAATGTPPTVAATTVVTPTNATVPPTATSVVTPTKTSVPPTATAVVTPTKVVTPTATLPKPTATQASGVVTPTATLTRTPTTVVTATKTVTPTATKAPTATPTKPKALAPRAGTVSSLSTAFTVQNMDQTTTANVTGAFYDTSGNTVGSGVTCPLLLPNRNCTVDQRVIGGGLDGQTNWQGSVVLSSNTQLAAVVSEYSGNASTQGADFRADAYTGWSTIVASTNISLPQVLKGLYDSGSGVTINSFIAIQNTNPITPANVTVNYRQSTGTTYSHSGISIPAGASAMLDLSSGTSEPALASVSLFYGTATIASDQPVAVVTQYNAAGFLLIYSGFSSANAGTTLYLPQLLRNLYDPGSGLTWGTGVLVMSIDGTAATVTLNYTNYDGKTYSESQTNTMITFDNRSSSAIPSFYYGSGTLTSNKPIIAIVNYVVNASARGLQGGTYRAFAASGGGNTVFIPLLRKNSLDAGSGILWGTGVLGRLMGSSATTATITYYHSNGITYTQTANISPASPMFTFDQRSNASLPDGTMSAVITSSPAQSFNVIVNVAAPSTVYGDAFMTFSGVIP